MSIRVGIIGCGKIAQVRHIPEYMANPHVELYGFYDINQARTEELAKKYGGKAFASYEELLADETIEAVSVCAANHAHAEISIAALKAGKHVITEKPMASMFCARSLWLSLWKSAKPWWLQPRNPASI